MPPRFSLTVGAPLRFSPDGSRLVCLGANVVINDIVNHQRLWVSRAIKHPSEVSFSPNGEMLAVKSTSGRIVVLDTESGAVIHDHRNQKEGEGCAPFFCPDGQMLIDAAWHGALAVRNATSGAIQSQEAFPGEQLQRLSQSADRQTWLLQRHPRYNDIREASHNGFVSVHTWPLIPGTGRIIWFPFNATNAALSPDGKLCCFSEICPTPTLRIARVSDGEILARSAASTPAHGQEITWSPDGSLIASVERHRFVFFSASDLSQVAEVPAKYPSSIAFRPGTQEVALGTWNASAIAPISEVLQGHIKMK